MDLCRGIKLSQTVLCRDQNLKAGPQILIWTTLTSEKKNSYPSRGVLTVNTKVYKTQKGKVPSLPPENDTVLSEM